MTRITRIAGIVALGLATLTAIPAMAQTQGAPTGQMPPATQSAQNFSPDQLQKFANANTAILDIRKSAMQDMQEAEGKEGQTQVRQQAQQDMLGAIKDSGLTLQEYNQIGRAAQADPELAQQIQQMQ